MPRTPKNDQLCLQMHSYVVYGLSLKSEIDLPELLGTEVLKPYDPIPVEIREGDVPHDLPNALTSVEGYRISKNAALLGLPGTARFLITEGKSIKFTPEKGHEPSWLRIVLLSGALGILAYQRGLWPLHASAIVDGGSCIVLGGSSGAGKSTLAAGLSKHGLKLLTEDKLVVRRANGHWTAWPGVPFLHLTSQSAERGGLGLNTQASTSPRFGKFIHLDSMRYDLTPRPLKVVYLLDWSTEDSEPSIVQLSSANTFLKLRSSISLHGLISTMGRETLFLKWATDLMKDVPIFLFTRPRDYAQFDKSLEVLRNHWTSLE